MIKPILYTLSLALTFAFGYRAGTNGIFNHINTKS